MPPRREYPDLPMLAAGALVVERGKVLLVKRRREPNAGKWAIPGGLVELGETPKAAAERETLEEVGLLAEAGRLYAVVDDIHLDARGEVKYHFAIMDFVMKPTRGRIHLSSESAAYGWFDAAQVNSADVAAKTRTVALHLLSHGRRPPTDGSVTFLD